MNAARDGSAPPGRTPALAALSRMARLILPWLVAAGCLVYAFEMVRVEEGIAALQRARMELFLPLAVCAVLFWFALESAAYAYVFSRFNTHVTWREARSLRALSYLFTVIHWHLAKAAVVIRLDATHRVGILAGTSTLLLYQMIGVLVLALFASTGALLLPPRPGVESIALGALLLASGVIAALAAIRVDRPRLRLLEELRALSILQAHRKLALADVAIIGLARAAYQLVFVFVYWAGMRTFGLAPSFSHVMIATPILQVIGSLPIAPAGFGTQQAAMLLLFSDPAAAGRDGPAILAFGFSLPITTMILRALLACCYLGDLSGPAADAPGPTAGADASAARYSRRSR